ncbi:hypothetical protein [Bradyrhizobium sp. RDM4]|uniref:hypothetical protein n=1 Tax=Bradyrhizobium sp. RDM4 TaxID=3378765 RepID=UPI0038FCA52A
MAARTSRVLHRSLRETPPKAIGGEGVYLFAEDGRRVIDASGARQSHAWAISIRA